MMDGKIYATFSTDALLTADEVIFSSILSMFELGTLPHWYSWQGTDDTLVPFAIQFFISRMREQVDD
jgi:hypothetical protein